METTPKCFNNDTVYTERKSVGSWMAEFNSHYLLFNKKYRTHFDVIALMLEAAKDDGASRFSIMTRASTNSKQLKKFLKALIEMGFVEIGMKNGRALYKASDKGVAFLNQYYVLEEMLLDPHAKPRSGITQTVPQ
jgi:predicted transcriptional regulator